MLHWCYELYFWGLQCDFVWRRFVLWFFTLKIVGAVTDKQCDALWLPGTTAFPGLIWALVILGLKGWGAQIPVLGLEHPSAPSVCCSPRLIPARMIYGVAGISSTTHPWEVRTWTSLSCPKAHPAIRSTCGETTVRKPVRKPTSRIP